MSILQIPLSEIVLDPRLQMRALMDFETIDEYAEHFDSLPPGKIVREGAVNWLTGGWHRYHAAVKAKRATMPCTVREGTFLDALTEAAGENHGHGIRRTPEDKRRAVSALLAEPVWAGRSNRMVAEACHVSEHLVSKIRQESTQYSNGTEDTSKNDDGEKSGARARTRNDSDTGQSTNGQTRTDARGRQQPANKPKILCESCQHRKDVGKPLIAKCEECAKLRKKKKTLREEVDDELAETNEEKPEPTIEELMKEQNAKLESFCRKLMKLVDEELPHDAWLDDNMNRRDSAIQKFKDGCATVRSAKCSYICPMCKGDGCTKCHKTGRVPTYQYQQLV